jgi:hypothetical protein
MLIKKVNRTPITGMKETRLTRIRPRTTARSGETLFFPKALIRLSPKK